MENEFEKKFLENNFYGDNWESLKNTNSSIVNFSFIWNLFEKKLFHKDFPRNWKGSRLTIKGEFNERFYEIYNWVKDRYDVTPEKIKKLFGNQKIGKEEFELMLRSSELESIIMGLLAWVYRLRNNYFHGEKDLNYEENELFQKANHFMIVCIKSNQRCSC